MRRMVKIAKNRKLNYSDFPKRMILKISHTPRVNQLLNYYEITQSIKLENRTLTAMKRLIVIHSNFVVHSNIRCCS